LQPADHDYAAVVPRFLDAALAGRPVEVHGDGCQSRDFTYVGTVRRVLADAVAGSVTADGPVNLAFGSRVTLLDVLAELERQLGRPVERHHVEPRAGDVRHSQADAGRLHHLFPGIQPVSLPEGLAHTLDWFGTR
jgi:UDP-glucose 4-epimerase